MLNEVAKVGLYGLSKMMYAKAGKLMRHVSYEDGGCSQLYNKYVGDWGGESTEYKFEAIKNGEVIKEVVIGPMNSHELSVDVSKTELVEGRSYDVAAIRITDRDEHGNVLPFANDPVSFKTSGPIELIGPKV